MVHSAMHLALLSTAEGLTVLYLRSISNYFYIPSNSIELRFL